MTNDNYKAWTYTAFCIFRLRGGSTMRIGMDIGSTTIKCVVLDENDQISIPHMKDITVTFSKRHVNC